MRRGVCGAAVWRHQCPTDRHIPGKTDYPALPPPAASPPPPTSADATAVAITRTTRHPSSGSATGGGLSTSTTSFISLSCVKPRGRFPHAPPPLPIPRARRGAAGGHRGSPQTPPRPSVAAASPEGRLAVTSLPGGTRRKQGPCVHCRRAPQPPTMSCKSSRRRNQSSNCQVAEMGGRCAQPSPTVGRAGTRANQTGRNVDAASTASIARITAGPPPLPPLATAA